MIEKHALAKQYIYQNHRQPIQLLNNILWLAGVYVLTAGVVIKQTNNHSISAISTAPNRSTFTL